MALIFIGLWALVGGVLSLICVATFGAFAFVLAPIIGSACAVLAGLRLSWRGSDAVPRLSKTAQAAIGARLRSTYATFIEQPIPDHLAALAVRLS
jgi:hypothetical protein